MDSTREEEGPDSSRDRSHSFGPSPTDMSQQSELTAPGGAESRGQEPGPGQLRGSALPDSPHSSTETVRRRSEVSIPASQETYTPSIPESTAPPPSRGPTRTITTGSIPGRSPAHSPQPRQPRPVRSRQNSRRQSSAQAPYRGSKFSVDDDAREVEADAAEQQQRRREQYLSMRRGFSAGPRGTLSRLQSLHDVPAEDDEDRDGHDDDDDNDDDENDTEEHDEHTTGGEYLSSSGLGINPGPVDRSEYEPDDFHDQGEEANMDHDGALETDNYITRDDGEADDNNDDDGDAPDGIDAIDVDAGINDDADDDEDVSDAESFTLKDRQQAINATHPFGIRLWKPALYKKSRSVQKTAEGDIHSSPGGQVSAILLLFNVAWTVFFGWWMALATAFGAIVCLLLAAAPGAGGREYGLVLWGLAGYLFYPFGKFVRLERDDAYLHEDQGEGRSISEYEQWQSGDLENGRLFFGPYDGQSRSIVGRSRRSIDSEPSETDSLLQRSRVLDDRPRQERDGRRGARARARARARRQHAASHGASGLDGHHLEDGHSDQGEDDDEDDDDDERTFKRRLFGRGQWTVGRVIFFVIFWSVIAPTLLVVSAVCWFLVFWIPMAKVTMLLFSHLRRHPLALSFSPDTLTARGDPDAPCSSILLCTYRAVGPKYWKYTVDGTNVFLINLLAVVGFVVLDYLVLIRLLGAGNPLASPAFLFSSALLSIIPLAYFIGQAVASISAQSSMGLGAAINAFFSTVVEVFLYCVALKQGKARLVEGSIVGSIFAGILFLPGLSMCFGAIKRKTQRFNAKSAGVTSTMLLFAVLSAFSPTLFYRIYGTHETPALDDRFFLSAVRPFCYLNAILLFLAYVIGLWFTLRTHAAVIWNVEPDEKKQDDHHLTQRHPPHTPHAAHHNQTHHQHLHAGESSAVDVRDSQMYKRILGHSLKQVGLQPDDHTAAPSLRGDSSVRSAPLQLPSVATGGGAPLLHVVPPKPVVTPAVTPPHLVTIPGLSEADNQLLVREVAEMAATAATLAARDSVRRRTSGLVSAASRPPPSARLATFDEAAGGGGGGDATTSAAAATAAATAAAAAAVGHDAPNWSRRKSAIILLGATVLYAIIAEVLVDTVDVVLEGIQVDEKFLGITLFALVPNTTEFLNAISFAMNGNIALSMEIGSAYALQVCLLQIPALVLFSAFYVVPTTDPSTPPSSADAAAHTFSLIFPQWDTVSVILCVFLLSYMYGEGKSNYFKGSILLLSYAVVLAGFFFSGFASEDGDWTAGAGGQSRLDVLRDGQWV